MTVVKLTAQAAEQVAGHDGAPVRSPTGWRVVEPCKIAAEVAHPPHQAARTGYAAAVASHLPSISQRGQVQVVDAARREVALPLPVQPSISALQLLLPSTTAVQPQRLYDGAGGTC